MKIRVQETEHPRYKYEVVCPPKFFGKRIRKPFKTKAEANAEKMKLLAKYEDSKSGPLDPDVHVLMQRYQKLLNVDEIQEALDAKVEHLGKCRKSFAEVGAEFVEELEMLLKRKAVGEEHVRDYRYAVPKIARWLDDPELREMDKALLDDFIDDQLSRIGQGGNFKSPRTIKNYMDIISAVFNFAIRQGYVATNPTHLVRQKDYKPAVGILKPEEIKGLLKHADHYMACWIMLGAFGGLRSSEIGLVKWENIRLDEGQFFVDGKKNVCAQRWIHLTPPLKAFFQKLLAAGPRTGLVMAGMKMATICRRRQRLCKKAEITIPRNALRHSFGSHHLVKYQNQYVTAGEMGHSSPQITFSAYREAVLKSQADKYWAIRMGAVAESEEDVEIAA
jgi:integrase